jgi:hypothetical protein
MEMENSKKIECLLSEDGQMQWEKTAIIFNKTTGLRD